jgi:hypothetical protein
MNLNNENHERISKKKITEKDITSSKNLNIQTIQTVVDPNW